MFVGCTSDDDPIYLDNIQLSTSYVALPTNGGSTKVTLNAKGDWAFEKSVARTEKDAEGKNVTNYYETPEWLTISPLSGTAGENIELTFSAPAATSTNQATVKLTCGGQTQEINVLQYAEETDPEILTVAQAVALIRSGNAPAGPAYVRGIVCRIQEISTSYGNATYFLSDDGSYGADNWLEVYRGKWYNGESFTDENAFSVGDEMVIKGVLVDYNGTPETSTGTCEVISLTKSLIKVDSLDVAELPIEGGIVNAALTCKGNGISVEIPAEAQSWLSIAGIDTKNAIVKFRAQPNTGGDRNTTVIFKTVDGGKEYSASAAIAQKGAILEVSVADFLAAAVGDTQYRLTGIVMELYSSDSQGQSFYIQDYSGQTLVYRAAGFKESGAKVGDVVTVVGKRGAYKETAQLTSGTFEELKYAVETVTIAQFREKADSKDVYYMITGTVGKVAEASLGAKDDIEKYGNFDLTDETGSVYIYGVTDGWGGPKGTFSNLSVDYGDKLTIVAYKTTYKGLVEGVGMFFANEKAAEPDVPTVTGQSAAAPFTVAEAIAKCAEIGATSDGVIYYAKGKISSIKEISTSYGNGTFNISDDGTDTNALTCYRAYSLDNNKFAAEDEVKVGDEVIVCGKLVNYTVKSGNVTPEFSGNVYIYSLNGKTK
ncbi:MAG: BACON domain-containing protein [Prevotella sp.]|nr:BACON domain-containing protein [Prevotella sp.]